MKSKFRFIIPSIITIIILLVLFYFQGLYPFTDNSIVQVDADYQFIPVLYRIYDFLHGNGNIIYDDIGLGNNIYISMIIQGSIFSPLSLLLYFTSRSNIPCFFNIILIIKMCLLSLTTYIYINSKYKINEYYKIVFSVLYTFCGWILLNYFNIMWLDSVILFPLIIMYLEKLLKNGKYFGYIITLSLSLMISYYISYFILLFVLLYSFIYIFMKLDKRMVKKAIFKLGIATVISILISSFSLLPALYQTFNSSRFDSSYTSGLFDNFMNKSLFLMMSSVFIILFIKLIFKFRKDKKNIYIYILLFILFGIGLFVEPINLSIHMGSYWSFPYRYSFITLFVMMSGCLYYIEKFGIKGFSKYQLFRLIVFFGLGILLVYLNKMYYKDIVDSMIILDFKDQDVYKNILVIFVIMIFMISLSLGFKNKYYRYMSFSLVCLIQIFVYSSWSMYYADGYYLTKNSNNINNNIDIIHSDLDRYKMGYRNYTPDYGFIYNVNTLDNWLHILPSKEIDIYNRLGYGNSGTSVRSYGGTVFTDYLFNVKYLINDNIDYVKYGMYTFLDSYDNFYLYKYNYNNSFGVIYDKIKDYDYKGLKGFYLHNMMYKELYNTDSDIIKIDNYYYESVNKISIDYEIEENGFVYLNLYNSIEMIDYILINGVYFNKIDEEHIMDLGVYDENIKLEIFLKEKNYFNFDIGFIKYDDIMKLSNTDIDVKKLNNGYKIDLVNDKKNGYLFLPINNIDGLNVYVNGRLVDIDSYLDNFVSIKLDMGINKIDIKYELPLFKIGLLFSLLGFICLFLFSKIPNNKIILNITYYVYMVVCIMFYLYIYGYSMLKYYSH